MIDLHHVPNIKDSRRLLKGYTVESGVAIALPVHEHRNIKLQYLKDEKCPRRLLAAEIWMLRRQTRIPTINLLKVIEFNKQRFLESYTKI